jgi:16S rRNA processing protein RimM
MRNDKPGPVAPSTGKTSPESDGSLSGAEFVTVAKVIKTQGRIGEVAAVLLTDFPERFSQPGPYYCLDKENRRGMIQLDDHWFHKGQIILKAAGVDSISQAEMLIGCEIQVPLEQRIELEEGSIYLSDLTGCTVFDAGREVGRIQDVQFGSGEAPLLIVKAGAGKEDKEYMIPFAAEFLKKLDVPQKRVEMLLPAGMLELDAPLSNDEKERQKNRD